MTDTTTEQPVWTTWPTGAAIEQTDRDTWVWTGKRIGGKHLIARPQHDGWYRLLESDQLADYTWLPYRPTADENVIHWLWRAAQIDVQLAQERNANQAINQAIRRDWNTLNEHLNEYADQKSMCDDYENQLSEWNDEFSTLELTGRTKTYEVQVTVRAEFHKTVTVEATTSQAAKEQVDDMDDSEITDGLDMYDASEVSWDAEDGTAL